MTSSTRAESKWNSIYKLGGWAALSAVLVALVEILTFYALYAAHRRGACQPYAALAMITAFLGLAVFYATNWAFQHGLVRPDCAETVSSGKRHIFGIMAM